VLWYTNSVLHLPRPEDWPVMPAHTAGFRLVPIGFWASILLRRRNESSLILHWKK
jgi:primary-amine oxidase